VGDYRDSSGKFHGFFWDAGLFLTIDVPFPGATGTAARGINNVGQIVGVYNDSSGIPHGFPYRNGMFTTIDFSGAIATFTDDINDRGQIVEATSIMVSELIVFFLRMECLTPSM
jgi:probable HAF family extracellular repeat protein